MKKRTTRLGRGNLSNKGVKGRGLPRKVKGGYKLRNRVVPFGKLAKKWKTGLRKKWQKTTVLNRSAMSYLKSTKIGIRLARKIFKEKGARWVLKRQREQMKALEAHQFENDDTLGRDDWFMMADERIMTADELYFFYAPP